MKKETPINLFVDAHVFDGEFQGSRTFIKEIYKFLGRKKDVRIHMGGNNVAVLKETFPDLPNVQFHQYRWKSKFLRLLIDIPSIIRKNNIGYAHYQYIIPVLLNAKTIVTIHDVVYKDFPEEFSVFYRLSKYLLYKHAAKRAFHITTVSEHSRYAIQRYLAVPAKKITITPNGVSESFFIARSKNDDRRKLEQQNGYSKFILYVSRIEPRKNHAALIRSYLELGLNQKGIHLVFIGHTSIPCAEMDALLQQLSPEQSASIHHYTNIEEEELKRYYNAALVFAYPSKAEGFGIPPLEAAAFHTPVICSNTSAMEEFSFFGEGHINPYDQEALTKSLRVYITHPPAEEQLLEIAETIRKKYNWSASANKFYEILQTKYS
ncbi:glycosyltransferase family 1 protein [Parasegetibacter sp. NRK P23]|uniref:glycosyltransferase family 4 protein n=1 Tax=Parasegetibacter sp. NRK P23 TaxID=2942999 RepID=UPI0020438702|nr:glycosyltransferase family 1 protein [Parasegetibacter sp. NRK P23]MCM5527508.1 glycosyltransferase family 4 protein [Parasegetibacter sp. NRK P23]